MSHKPAGSGCPIGNCGGCHRAAGHRPGSGGGGGGRDPALQVNRFRPSWTEPGDSPHSTEEVRPPESWQRA